MCRETVPLNLPDTDLSDEAAAQLVEFLRELTDAIESHFYAQIRRHYHGVEDRQLELASDHAPPF
jgi:hypothetical protein